VGFQGKTPPFKEGKPKLPLGNPTTLTKNNSNNPLFRFKFPKPAILTCCPSKGHYCLEGRPSWGVGSPIKCSYLIRGIMIWFIVNLSNYLQLFNIIKETP